MVDDRREECGAQRAPVWMLILLCAACCAAVATPLWAAPAARSAQEEEEPDPDRASLTLPAAPLAVEDLPEAYRQWLAEVGFIMTEEERRVFLSLRKDYQRDAFIREFWRQRDPFPDTGRNELLSRWKENVEQARRLFRNFDDDRSKVLMLNGSPGIRHRIVCRSAFWPLEIWFYPQGSRIYKFPFIAVFYQRVRTQPFRLFYLDYGYDDLVAFDRNASCRPEDAEVLRFAMRWLSEKGVIEAKNITDRISSAPPPISREWVQTFASYSTELPTAAQGFDAEVVFDYPGWYQNRTVLQGVIQVPVDQVEVAELAGHRSYNFALVGEVLSGEDLFDSFRYRFDPLAEEIGSGEIPLVFQRYLRPGGPYTVVLRLEDLNSGRFYRVAEDIEVPRVTTAELPPPADPRLASALKEANAALANGETTVKLVPPIGELLTGMVRFDTLIVGDSVRQVRFSMDGTPVLTKKTPPYSVELDLGDYPRTQTLRAVAYDQEGGELASDELLLNVSGSRFRIRLVEPQRGKTYENSLRARAEVEIPSGDTLERVELFLNETRVATLYQPPFVQPIVLPDEDVLYVRAVAYRTDGSSTEDAVFINAPDYSDDLEIQFVELFTTVLNRQGRPVQDLTREDVSVAEDGDSQEILRFEQVKDLPFHAGILLDVSASMNDRLETARDAALAFFEAAVQPKDRAALITFNDRPFLSVQFTNDVSAFAGGLTGLKAERGTALYDSLIYSLFYFTGIRGQRALILLSDGKDELSRFTFTDTLEYARRAGVTVYTIGLDLPRKDKDSRRYLTKLADETGGRPFFITSIDELGDVYATIQEELRSQYLIAYQSSNTSTDRKFREVRVRSGRRDVEIKTISGYYP